VVVKVKSGAAAAEDNKTPFLEKEGLKTRKTK